MLKPYVSLGIRDVCKKNVQGKFKFAYRGGSYLGAPGKEIYFGLKNMSDQELNEISQILSNFFPIKSTPDNHVKWAACLRYIYGCFEKQGCLRSDSDCKRMKEEKPDWELSDKFINYLESNFLKSDNFYGLTLLYEMKGHRFGDQAIIFDEKFLDQMMIFYNKSLFFANKINCVKHLFANYYWAASYYEKCNKIDNAIELHKKNITQMILYCPDNRQGYQSKAQDSIEFLRNNMQKDNFNQWYNIVIKDISKSKMSKWPIWKNFRK